MSRLKPPKLNDAELVDSAKAFAKAFRDAANLQIPPTRFALGSCMSLGAAGVVEITSDVESTMAKLRTRAMKLLGSKAGHEHAIHQTLFKQAHQSVISAQNPDEMAAALIKAVFDQGLITYDYVAPNHLFKFKSTKSIQIGSVRAMLISDLQTERQSAFPGGKVTLIPGDEYNMAFDADMVSITMKQLCWVVSVDAIAENVAEEAKWLIDVAVSLLRLSYSSWKGVPPATGHCEPHPIQKPIWQNEDVRFQGQTILPGAVKMPPWYEIDLDVEEMVETSEFRTKATEIFSPSKNSLAARVGQGLGWLSRGRQSADRAERLLYFFTAIEALLSGTDKTAPVVQTITRHAAVILSNNNVERQRYASVLKALYNLRSALVHNGTRDVDWTSANTAQIYAEALFIQILNNVSLSIQYDIFSNQIAVASYGLAWPPDHSASS